ncbi:hypothetical protein ANO11243_084280 [Dothideomycetidae sp. 11243]|nr:hypothetical protein ANO11243_084280 [fungal sp. No.11243]
MRSHISLAAMLALAAAAPAPIPQDIDFDLVDALPAPTYSIAVGATAQVITYDPSAIVSAAQAQITSDVASDPAVTLVKRTACAPQPTGAKNAPVVATDTPTAFSNNTAFASIALAAPVPSGYVQRFQNLNASNNAYGYMGYTTLDSYDTALCAKKCTALKGCSSINIYFERDPSVEPAAACPNPPSYTMIKCVFWGGPVNTANALNTGQWRQNFQVVIAGSNGYESSYATPQGYGNPVALNAAINAPYDAYGFDSYMGVALFNSGPFDLQLCADACSLKSQYALAHPPTDGSPVQTCQFFNTYILYVNNLTNPQGQYCAMYSETWSSKYATNVGQWRGSDWYFIGNSYAVSNSSNPSSASPNAAVHQASKDISYWSISSYCSTKYGFYSTKTVTAKATAYTTATVTKVVPTTTTVFVNPAQKRDVAASVTTTVAGPSFASASSSLPTITGVAMLPVLAPVANGSAPLLTVSLESLAVFTTDLSAVHALSKRDAVVEPSVLTKYPNSIVSSACALQPSATLPPSTTTTTTTTTLAYKSSVTTTSTSTTTVTSTTTTVPTVVPVAHPVQALTFQLEVANGTEAGLYLGPDPNNSAANMDLLALVNATSASTFSIDPSTGTLLQGTWIVQGASSGGAYSGIGAADGLFSNGEPLICSAGLDGSVGCQTQSNGHSVFGVCPQYSWLWLFGTEADAEAFCPDGTGALVFKAVLV